MKKSVFLAALAVAVLSPSLALAASIVVHNTGVGPTDVLVAPGNQTSFWALSAKPAGASEVIGSNPFRYFNGAYFADTSTAAWVSPQADGNAGPTGIYTYDLVIDLTGLNPATAIISGTFGTDNSGAISLNANPPVATTGFAAFGSPTSFTFNGGFLPGLNIIHLQVNNETDPTAFFVSFTSASAAPAIITEVPVNSWPVLLGLAMLLAALGSLLAARRSSR
jgi:hypothetical protein